MAVTTVSLTKFLTRDKSNLLDNRHVNVFFKTSRDYQNIFVTLLSTFWRTPSRQTLPSARVFFANLSLIDV